MISLPSLLFFDPRFVGVAGGPAALCSIGWAWRRKPSLFFNGFAALVIYAVLIVVGIFGALAVADYHSVNSGGPEPSFFAYWLPFGIVAFATPLGNGARRTGLAR